MTFFGNCRATGIGSLPATDAREAVETVLACCPDLPHWPQLPRVSRAEGMNEQALAGLPGLAITGEGCLRLVQDEAFFLGVERVMAAHAAGDPSVAAMTPANAAGFEPFVAAVRERGIRQAKGQIAGPVTVGMAVLGEDGNPILYNEVLRDVLVKFLSLRVRWQAARLRAAGAEPIVFVDEPFLSSFGTPFFGWGVGQVREVLEAVAAGAEITGSHCCSNTDWSIFLESRLSVVSFDAFEFAENFLMYRDALAAFLARGGNLAWGIVPTDPDLQSGLTVKSLSDRLLPLVAKVEALGFKREQVLRQSLITPACGLGSRDAATAKRALALVRDLSASLRREFLGAK
jgi:methionine synthase II (cobalamin-independent)